MSKGQFNANIQAQAARDAGVLTARATSAAAKKQIEHETSVREAKEAKLKECIKNFASLDESSLFRKTDKELAHFQAEYPPESPQYALALNEWNRRLVTRQVKATRFAAVIGFVGIIIGSFLGWFLASVEPPDVTDPHKNPKIQQRSDIHQGKHPDKISPESK